MEELQVSAVYLSAAQESGEEGQRHMPSWPPALSNPSPQWEEAMENGVVASTHFQYTDQGWPRTQITALNYVEVTCSNCLEMTLLLYWNSWTGDSTEEPRRSWKMSPILPSWHCLVLQHSNMPLKQSFKRQQWAKQPQSNLKWVPTFKILDIPNENRDVLLLSKNQHVCIRVLLHQVGGTAAALPTLWAMKYALALVELLWKVHCSPWFPENHWTFNLWCQTQDSDKTSYLSTSCWSHKR